jgi:phage baseplate assembly protein W
MLGSDIELAEYFLGADLQISNTGDVGIISGARNLAQALLHRLRTARGELEELGHPQYGSNIHDFVGQPNNWETRERLKLAIRDTIRQEPRIKEIVSISVKPRQSIVQGSQTSTDSKTKTTAILMTSNSLYEEAEPADNKGRKAEMENTNEAEIQLSKKRLSPDGNTNDFLNSVDIDIVIVPMGSKQPLQITFPFNLE